MNVGDLIAEGWTVYAVPASLYGNPDADALIQGNAAEGLINLSCCISQPGYSVWYYMAVSPEAKPMWNTVVPNAYEVNLGEEALSSEVPGIGDELEPSGANPLGMIGSPINIPWLNVAIPVWMLFLLAYFALKAAK